MIKRILKFEIKQLSIAKHGNSRQTPLWGKTFHHKNKHIVQILNNTLRYTTEKYKYISYIYQIKNPRVRICKSANEQIVEQR